MPKARKSRPPPQPDADAQLDALLAEHPEWAGDLDQAMAFIRATAVPAVPAVAVPAVPDVPRETSPAELVPSRTAPSRDWSLGDPAATDRLCRAIINADGDFEVGRIQAGCPEDIFWALIEDDAFDARYRKLSFKMKVLPKLPLAQAAAMTDGGAYGMAQAMNTNIKEDASESEQAKMRALRAGGKAAYVRALRDMRDRADTLLRMLEGVKPPDTELISGMIRDITCQPHEIANGG